MEYDLTQPAQRRGARAEEIRLSHAGRGRSPATSAPTAWPSSSIARPGRAAQRARSTRAATPRRPGEALRRRAHAAGLRARGSGGEDPDARWRSSDKLVCAPSARDAERRDWDSDRSASSRRTISRRSAIGDLPDELARTFTETDGTRGRIVYISADRRRERRRRALPRSAGPTPSRGPTARRRRASSRLGPRRHLRRHVDADRRRRAHGDRRSRSRATVLVVVVAFRGGRGSLACSRAPRRRRLDGRRRSVLTA